MWQKFKNYYHLLQAFVASVYFGFPSKNLEVIGVTGTDGKSTTASMIYKILTDSGKKAALLTSVGVYIGVKTYQTGTHVTTPGPFQVQQILKKAKDKNIRYFVIEATSHGLDQHRLACINFKIAAITNVTNEHFDYHGNWQNYLKAKAKLFKNVHFSVLNQDDKSYKYLKDTASGKVLTYANTLRADFNLKNFPIKLKVFGDYNLENALAAATVATAIGIDKKTILKSLAKFEGIAGRMQKINVGQNFSTYIDFAHTPNALARACTNLKSIARKNSSRLIIVFGAAGERDRLKRPQMGKVSAQLADITILTAEDPRSEKVEDICFQIAKGLIAQNKKEGNDFFIIADRAKAIDFAVRIAKAKDVVVFFGKGHEKSMSFKDKDIPWDEFKVARDAIVTKVKNENTIYKST